MDRISLINAIVNNVWAIDARTINAYLPSIMKVFSGESQSITHPGQNLVFGEDLVKANKRKNAAYAFSMVDNKFMRINKTADLSPKSVAVIPFSGVIMKDDFCGTPGTKTLAERVRNAINNPNIIAVIMDMESPGGTVSGTFECSDEIAMLKSEKPILGFVNSLATSGGYAILSGCTEIHASHKTAMVGSIGVCTTIWNYEKAFEEAGYKEIYINATTSPDKNSDFNNAYDGKVEDYQKNQLDPIHAIFKDTVKSGRGGKLNEGTLTGKVYYSEEAVKLGLIDQVSSFEQCLNRAYELAN